VVRAELPRTYNKLPGAAQMFARLAKTSRVSVPLMTISQDYTRFRLMCITAHPDDEAGGFGGTLLKYGEAGAETSIVCLTAGTAATHRAGAKTPDELATIRKREFADSCKVLKIHHSEVLDYPDGGLDKQPTLVVVADLVRRIRRFRPHVLLTFGGEGAVTGHPDHSMASTFATLAFHWAGRTNRLADQLDHGGIQPHRAQKLYYQTNSFTMPDRPAVCMSPASAIIDIREYKDRKVAAFRCHLSQAPLFPFFEETVRRRMDEERFLLAAYAVASETSRETDVFAGVIP
jgi:LmbE family N-acetylglucosaminyl deacetylase